MSSGTYDPSKVVLVIGDLERRIKAGTTSDFALAAALKDPSITVEVDGVSGWTVVNGYAESATVTVYTLRPPEA